MMQLLWLTRGLFSVD